jgi:uncharacterized protein YjiK
MCTLLPALAFLLASLFCLTLTGCDSDRAIATAPATGVLAQYDFAGGETTVRLPSDLHEISDLAVAADGRLFAISDEKGVVFQTDPASGSIIKRFSVGEPPVEGDFEGLAIDGARFYAITSDGDLYSFLEGSDGGAVEFDLIDTRLRGYDIEALAVDSATSSLLIGCKEMPRSEYRGSRAILSWSLATRQLDDLPRFLLEEARIKELSGSKLFRPSGLARHRPSGAWLVLASQGNGIVELQGDSVIGFVDLSKGALPQPEGIAFLADGTLVISSEGPRRGTLVSYAHRAVTNQP